MRQAELESSQAHLESLQSQNTELQYQLRESEQRLTLLNEDFAEARREQDSQPRELGTPAEDVARLLSSAEAKYEAKIAELKKNLIVVEQERNDSEAQWSRKLRDKVRETEELRNVLGSAAKAHQQDEGVVGELKAEIQRLQEAIRVHQVEIAAFRLQADQFKDLEVCDISFVFSQRLTFFFRFLSMHMTWS